MMKSFSKRIALPACCTLILFALSSCFHKDVMNDPADDVSQSFIYSGKNGAYIITQELIFQATSKSSGGGISRISGYNECRLTSYDLATGAMLGRVEIGEEIDAGCKILGVVNDQVWCYSVDQEVGLHYRDPKTLEVQKKESELTVLNGFDFSRPEWSRIEDYYNYDVTNGMIVLTDMKGLLYHLDAVNNSLKETETEMPGEDWSSDYLSSSAYFNSEDYVSFNGDGDRKKLQWKYEDTTADLPFLKPQLFLDLNEESLYRREQERIRKITAQLDSAKAALDKVIAAHPVFADESASWSEMTEEERGMRNDFYNMKREVEEIDRNLEDLTDAFDDNNDYALSDKPYSCLVYSASTVSDTARAILTCVDQSKPKKFVERWHLDLTSFYYDPDKAEGAGVFDEGDPEFGYRWADLHDGKFVMIAQLQMICVDMSSGKKLWEIKL
jgi:hypothetical protein